MKKKPFFACDFREHFSALTDEQAGKIVKAVFNLHPAAGNAVQNLTETCFEDKFLQAYWQLTKELVQKQTSLFDKRQFTSAQNGKKGGRPKNPKNLKNLNNAIQNLRLIEEEILRRKSLNSKDNKPDGSF